MIAFLNAVLVSLVCLFGYAWVGYPLLLLLFSRGKKKTPPPPRSTSSLPTHHIHIIVAAHNEQPVIAERIRNLQQLEYQKDKLSVYVGTDGCTDATAQEARAAAHGDGGIHIQEFSENRGKVAVLKDLVLEAAQAAANSKTDVPALLVFSDANTMFAPNAINMLIRHFADPLVGAVCGRLVFTPLAHAEIASGTIENPSEEGAYWKLETWLKTKESDLDSCLGANGAIYAIRPELFWNAIPTNTIVDDLVIGMKVREQGFLMHYDPDAIAYEEIPDIEDEWVRRVRIGAGDYQAAALCRACLSPRYGWFAWAFWSHKILRWFTPHVLILLGAISYALTALALYHKSFDALPAYSVALGISLLLTAGHLGNRLRHKKQSGSIARLLAICDHFVSMHAALFIGYIRFCRGNMSGSWKRTPRG